MKPPACLSNAATEIGTIASVPVPRSMTIDATQNPSFHQMPPHLSRKFPPRATLWFLESSVLRWDGRTSKLRGHGDHARTSPRMMSRRRSWHLVDLDMLKGGQCRACPSWRWRYRGLDRWWWRSMHPVTLCVDLLMEAIPGDSDGIRQVGHDRINDANVVRPPFFFVLSRSGDCVTWDQMTGSLNGYVDNPISAMI